MGPAPAPHTPGICEEKGRLECRYRKARAAFDTARTIIRQRVGRSSKDEYSTLVDVFDLAWDLLLDAGRGLTTHIREHGCGVMQEAPPECKSIW